MSITTISNSTMKNTLAKLLAQENLNIEVQPVKTASFNLVSRVLTLPVLENTSPDVYTLFVGHEVGHALYTPASAWMSALDTLKKGILNVVEDARIERLIKQKYPGIKYDFIKGYTELLNRGFFEVSVPEIDNLKFIDRMNIHAKIGGHLSVKFSPEEYVYVSRLMKTETFDDVITLTKDVQEFIVDQWKQKKIKIKFDPSMLDPLQENDLEFDNNGDYGDDDEIEFGSDPDEENEDYGNEPDEENEEDLNFGPYSGDRGSFEPNDDETNDQEPNRDDEDFEIEQELESDTIEAFNRNFETFVSTDSDPVVNLKIPKVNSDDFIVDYKTIIARFNEESYVKLNELSRKKFVEFRKSSLPVVSYLVKEFELKKNAAQMKKASISTSGDLNEDRLYAYRISDDIFKKLTVVPDGKNHGLIMFLDWSGSMTHILSDTIKQCLSLILFCRKVNIPFEVYAFTTSYRGCTKHPFELVESKYKKDEIIFNNKYFALMNLFSSKMTANELSYMANNILSWDKFVYNMPWFNLGGTPLNNAVIVGMDLIPKFRKKYKLQVINTVILTDGDSHDLSYLTNENRINVEDLYTVDFHDWRRRNTKIVLTDDVSKTIVKVDPISSTGTTEALMKLFKIRTNNKIIGIRLASAFKHAGNLVTNNYYEYHTLFNKNKSVSMTTDSYDKLLVIKTDSMKINDKLDIKIKDKMTKSKMVSEFKKFRKTKLLNRIILKEFIEVIS